MPTVQEILDHPDVRPTFVLRPGYKAPLPPDLGRFVRNSAAWERDPVTGAFTKVSSGEIRTSGAGQDYLVEGYANTQLLTDPTDASAGGWGPRNLNFVSLGSEYGVPVQKLEEPSETSTHAHDISQAVSLTDGDPFHFSPILRPNGRNWVCLTVRETDGTNNQLKDFFFDLQNETVGSAETLDYGTVIASYVEPFGGGFKIPVLVIRMSAGSQIDQAYIRLAESDGTDVYTGDGSSGIDFLLGHATGREQRTFPILESTASTNQDSLKPIYNGQPNWWNSNEATFYLEFTPLFENFYKVADILATDSGKRHLYATGVSGTIKAKDPNNKANTNTQVIPFSKNKLCLSLTRSEMRLAANGATATSPHDGSLLDVTDMEFARAGSLGPILIHDFSYRTAALSIGECKNETV